MRADFVDANAILCLLADGETVEEPLVHGGTVSVQAPCSEDMQGGLLVEGRLRIINPFD